MGGSDPFVPPFTAVQVPSDVGSSAIEMQLDDAHQKPFELAYNYNYILYHTPENGREWLTLIEFEITGMRHELHDPKDINFKGDWVQGIRDKMRMLISYDNPKEETTIEVLELMPRDAEKGYVPSEGSIASSSWGGRMPSIAEDLYTMNRSYKPGDWNECGPKNDQWRQNLCGIEDFTEWLKNDVGMDPHVILTLFVVLCIIVGVMLAFALWKFYRLARGQLATWDQRAEESDGEERSGLLAGNEELDEEEKFVSTKAHTSEP